jgi:hypothetical protein
LMTRAEALTSSRGQGLFVSRLGVIGGVRKGLPSLTIVPVVYILPDLILLITVPLLNFTFELISSTVDRGQVASESLPHCSLTLPLTCFQFPSNRFQSMLALPRFNVSRETVFCVRLFHHGSGLLATRIFVLCYRRHWWAYFARLGEGNRSLICRPRSLNLRRGTLGLTVDFARAIAGGPFDAPHVTGTA